MLDNLIVAVGTLFLSSAMFYSIWLVRDEKDFTGVVWIYSTSIVAIALSLLSVKYFGLILFS